MKSTGSWYSVRMDSGEVMECRIKGKFRMKGIKTTNPVAVGDVVEVEMNPDGAVINRIEELYYPEIDKPVEGSAYYRRECRSGGVGRDGESSRDVHCFYRSFFGIRGGIPDPGYTRV